MTEIDEGLAIAIRKMMHPLEETVDRMAEDAVITRRMLDTLAAKPPESKSDKLFAALAKAQAEIENAEQDSTNEHWHQKYASLASVMNAIRGPLSKNGLAILQCPEYQTVDKGVLLGLTTILGHTSGQSIENYFTMYPPKQDPQGIGSCLTYMRRYTAMAICGIAGGVDDDAEDTREDPNDYERITPQEADKIFATADDLFGERADAAVNKMLNRIFSVQRVSDIKAGEADVAIQNLKNAKKLMDERAKEEAKLEEKLKDKDKAEAKAAKEK